MEKSIKCQKYFSCVSNSFLYIASYIYISFNSKNIYLKGNCKRTKFAPACQLCPYAKKNFETIKKLIYQKKKKSNMADV